MVAPGIAKRWEDSLDGCTYHFFLNEQALWNDGSPVRAIDFERTFKRILNPEVPSPMAKYFVDVQGALEYQDGQLDARWVGITAEDDLTLRIQLRQPIGFILQLWSIPTLAPVPPDRSRAD